MAEITDSFGRSINDAKMSVDQLRGLIESLLKGNASSSMKMPDPQTIKRDRVMQEIHDMMKKHYKKYDDDIKEGQQYLKQIVDHFKSFEDMQKKAAKSNKAKPQKDSDSFVNKANRSLGGGGGGNGKKPPSHGGASGGDGGMNKRTVNGFSGFFDDSRYQMNYFQDGLNGLSNSVAKLEKMFLGFNAVETLFGDLIDQERQFAQEVRATAYEVGVSSKEFEKLGDTAKFTGKNRTEFQKNYLGLLKKGLRDEKSALNIGMAQLNTEQQLGLKAEALQETFVGWKEELQMSDDQVASMGRGLRDVARFTGLTGENLTKAVSASDSFLKNMKNAGTFSTRAAKNFIEMTANAQKLGVSDGVNPILKSISSTNAFFTETDKGMQAFLASAAHNVGLYDKLYTGTLADSKEDLGKFSKGMRQQFQNMFGESIDDIDKMSAERKAVINMQMKKAGMGELGAFQKQMQVFEMSSQSLAEKIGNVNKQMTQKLTIEEKSGLMEEKRKLELSASLDLLTAIGESAKGTNDMNEALTKFGDKKEGFVQDMSALGIKWTSDMDVMRGAFNKSIENINESLKKSGKSEMKIDGSEIEKALTENTAFRELSAKLTKGEQEASTAAKAQLDPLTAMQQTLMEINDTLRQFAQSWISKAMNSVVAKFVLLGLVITSVITKFGLLIASLSLSMTRMRDYVENVKGGLNGEDGKGLFGAIKDGFSRKRSVRDEHGQEMQIPKTGIFKGFTEFFTGRKAIAPKSGGVADHMPQKPRGPLSGEFDFGGVKEKAADAGAKAVDLAQPAIDKLKNTGFLKNAQPNAKTLLKAGLAVMLLAPAIVLLATALVKMTKMIVGAMGMDESEVQKTAFSIAGIILAAGAIALAVIGAGASLALLGALVNLAVEGTGGTGAASIAALVATGALGLMILAPAMILLALAIVKISKGVLSATGTNPEEAVKTASAVSQLLFAAASIAAACVAAFATLSVVGVFVSIATPLAALAAMGAVGIMAISSSMILLASAVVKLSQGIMDKIKIKPEEAAKTAESVGSLLMSAGKIAAACVTAFAALAVMGLFTSVAGPLAALAMAGALGIMALTPAMILLSLAVVTMSKKIMANIGMDGKQAEEVSKNVAGILDAASSIVKSCLGSAVALSIIGLAVSSGIFPLVAILGMAGATGIFLMIPAMVGLAGAVIELSKHVLSKIKIDPKEAMEVSKSVAGILDAASSIAKSCVLSAAYLSLIGLAVSTGVFLLVAGLGVLGAKGIMMMVPAMTALAGSVITLAQSVISKLNIKPDEAAKIASNVSTILVAAAKISGACVAASVGLAIIGTAVSMGVFPAIAAMAVPGANGIKMMVPGLSALSSAVLEVSAAVLGTMGMSPDQAQKTADAIGNIIVSFAKIVGSVAAISSILGVGGLATTASSTLKKNGGVLGMGLGSVIDSLQGKAKESVTNGAKMITDMIPTLQSIGGAIVQLNGSIGGMSIDSKKLSDFVDTVVLVLNKINELKEVGANSFSTMMSIMSTGGLRGMGRFLQMAIIDPINKDFPAIAQLDAVTNKLLMLKEVLDTISKIMDALGTTSAKISNSKNFNTEKIQKLMSAMGDETSKMAVPIPMRADANIGANNSANISTSATRISAEQTIQRSRANNQSSSSASSDLGVVASNTSEMVELTKRSIALTELLVKYLKPDNRAETNQGEAGNSKTKLTLTSPPRYFRMNDGLNKQTAMVSAQ